MSKDAPYTSGKRSFFFFIALFNLNHIRKYLKELNNFLIFDPGNISSRSKQGSQPDPLEILYKEGDILNIKVCVN